MTPHLTGVEAAFSTWLRHGCNVLATGSKHPILKGNQAGRCNVLYDVKGRRFGIFKGKTMADKA
jgi:hypothetical protein